MENIKAFDKARTQSLLTSDSSVVC